MVQRSLLLVALIALLSCAASVAQEEEDNFVRPNEAEECGEPIDFMAYAEGLENTNCGEEQCEYQEQAATLFDLKYRKDYKVVEYKTSPENEGEIVEVGGEPTQGTAATYILYPCGLEKPNDEWIQERIEANISEILFVEIPLTAVVTDDSTIGWMLEELEVLDRVRYGPDTATSPCLQKIVDSEEDGGCGRQFNSSFDPEPTNTTEFDIEFGFSASPAAKGVIFQASSDPGPLARAEHVMYLSTFFNKEAVASDWYKQVSDSYGEKAEAVEAAEAPPTVAWVSHDANGTAGFEVGPDGEPLPGPVTTFSFARYKALLTRDAGGALQVQADVVNITNAFASNDDVKLAADLFPSEADYNEAVLSVLAGVDILIDENYIPDAATLDTTVDEILGQFGLNGTDVDPALYPFIGNENVWRHDKARTEDGHDEWFGEAVARPDLVHSDLQEMITPGSLENHTFKFFRNMYSGENVASLGPESCTLACDAWEKQEALIFSAAASNGTEAEGTEGTDAEGTEGEEDVTEDEGSPAAHSAVAAGVVIATTLLASMI